MRYSEIDELRKEYEQTYIGVASIRPLENANPACPNAMLSKIALGRSLLDEVLDEITPYAQIEADKGWLKVINEGDQEAEITYQMIERFMQNEQPHQLERRARESELSTTSRAAERANIEPKDKEEPGQLSEPVAWSGSDEEREILTPELNAVRLDKSHQPETAKAIEQNTSKPKDVTRRLPKPIVAEVMIEGKSVRALFDSGSLGDFISTTVVDQLRLKREVLANPIGLQMAVQGSRSMINYSVDARISFQSIDDTRRFDVINIDNYDMILGTPFLFQHKIFIGFNPPSIAVGSPMPLPINGDLAIELKANVAEIFETGTGKCREDLRAPNDNIRRTMAETTPAPFRAFNHTIPRVDMSKQYHVRRIQRPKPPREVLDEKSQAYRVNPSTIKEPSTAYSPCPGQNSTPIPPTTTPQAPITPRTPVSLSAPDSIHQELVDVLSKPAAPNALNSLTQPTRNSSTNKPQDEVIDYEDDYTMDDVQQETPKAT